jgi:hypothetical protein
MGRKLLSLMVALGAVTLAGCGGGSQPSAEDARANELDYWSTAGSFKPQASCSKTGDKTYTCKVTIKSDVGSVACDGTDDLRYNASTKAFDRIRSDVKPASSSPTDAC